MSLYKFSEQIKKHLPLIAVLVVIILIIYLAWGALLTSSKGDEKFGKIPSLGLKSVVSDTLKVESSIASSVNLQVPDTLMVYKNKGVVKNSKFLKIFGFEGKPKEVSGYNVWQKKNKDFKVNQTEGKFTFTNSNSIKEGNFSKTSASKKAKDLLMDLGIVDSLADITVKSPEKLYLGVGEILEGVGIGIYNVYVINLGVNIDGNEVIYELGKDDLFEVWVGVDGQIIKASGPTNIIGYSETGTYTSKSLTTANDDVKNNKATIVSLSNQLSSTDNIVISYTTASVKYWITPKNGDFIQPVYIFEGRTAGASGTVVVKTAVGALRNNSYK